jgi:hypothetical protein
VAKVSADDVQSIAHINFVTNGLHDRTNELYEDLMERDHAQAKSNAQQICKMMAELIQSLSDEV